MTGAENMLEITGEVGDVVTINAHGWSPVSESPGLFTNDTGGQIVSIVSPADSGVDIQVNFTDDGTPV
jgi:hypothetical protein